jgi:hypothetical protein
MQRIKPAGWGSISCPTGNGARRVQFMLRRQDAVCLRSLARHLRQSGRADTARICLARQAELANFEDPAARQDWPELAVAVREPRRCRQRRGQLIRWSQWMRPDDLANMETLRAAAGLTSKSETLRFALRAECQRLREGTVS